MDDIKTEQEFLTQSQLAEALGVTETTVKYWLRTKSLIPAARTPTGKNLFTIAQKDTIETLRKNNEWCCVPVTRGERLYPTRVLAKALNVHTKTIRDWVREGYIIPRSRTPSGHALFSKTQINELVTDKEAGRFPSWKRTLMRDDLD